MLVCIEIVLAAAAFVLLVPAGVLFLEVWFATMRREPVASLTGPRPSVRVLVPAHDEAQVIAATLDSIRQELRASDKMLVVADNCSDNTADIAAAHGAGVVVRSDKTRRGKGYALDFGIRHLESDPAEVLVIMDADCQILAGSLDRLARTCAATARPIQALYLMHAPPGAALKMQIAQFAWIVRNQVRPEGLRRLGLPCQLMGTGMAFPWSCLRSANLANGHIVEDMKLGIDLALAGSPPQLCPQAVVTSEFPISSAGVQSQRTRWEHGHLSAIVSEAPRLFLAALSRPSGELLALALDLSVPPLALLVLLEAAIWCVSAALWAFTGIVLPLGIAMCGSLLLGAAVLLSWSQYGRDIIALRSLARAGLYALWKIPLYVRFVVARQVDWVRSKRGGD